MTRALTPTNLPEALILLGEDPSLVPMAGCTDLMVADAVERNDLPGVLDLSRVPELRGIRQVEGALEIGATTTFNEIGQSVDVQELLPALAAEDQAANLGSLIVHEVETCRTIGPLVVLVHRVETW